MSGASQVTINVTLTGGFTFVGLSGSTFSGALQVDNGLFQPVTLTVQTATTATGTLNTAISPGPHTFTFRFQGVTITPGAGSPVGTFSLAFNDVPPTTVNNITLNRVGLFITGFAGNVVIACIHGSSLISTKNGLKRIDQLVVEDEVLTGPNLDEYVKPTGIAQCWIQKPGPDHDAIIFEPDSLGENEPVKRLIIDPGHPMCTQKEFLEKGISSLKPAGSYFNGENIYVRKWVDPAVQAEPSVRFDIILPDPYCTYVANGIVVRSAGYEHHSYGNFI